MTDLSKTWLFRMMHIENIPHILKNGITHKSSLNANPSFIPIGDSSLINSRSQFVIPNGKRLGAYIPFYLGVRMPMLYVIQKGFNSVKATPPEKIVYCITSVQKILDAQLPFTFTNGHAVDGLTAFFDKKDIENIWDIADQVAVKAWYWNDEKDLDLKRRKEAEFLIEADIPFSSVVGWAVYNDVVKIELQKMGVTEEKIVVKPDYYF